MIELIMQFLYFSFFARSAKRRHVTTVRFTISQQNEDFTCFIIEVVLFQLLDDLEAVVFMVFGTF